MIQQRLFRFGDLTRPYRLITAFALAQLLAAALLIPLRDAAMPGVRLLTASGLTIGGAAMFAAELLLVVGLTYVLYAAAFVHRAARIALLCGYTFLISVPVIVVRPFWVTAALLACIVATWIAVAVAARMMRPHALARGELHFRAEILGVLFVLVLLAHALCFFAWGGAAAAAALLSSELSALGIFVVPALLIAGADLAEMAQATARDFVVPAFSNRNMLLGASVIVAAVEIWLFAPHLHSRRPVALVAEVLIFAGFAALVAWLMRSREQNGSGSLMKMAAVGALAFYGVTLLQIAFFMVGQLRAPVYAADDFTMRYPFSWMSTTVREHRADGREITVHSFAVLDGSRFDVVQGGRSDPLAVSQGAIARSAGSAGHGKSEVHFFEVASPAGFRVHRTDFELMRGSLHFERNAMSPYVRQAEAYGMPLGLAAIVLIALLARRRPGAGALFALLVAGIWTFSHASFFIWFFGVKEAAAPLIDMNETVVFSASAALLICAAALAFPKRIADAEMGKVLGVIVALGLLGGLYALYGAAIVSGEKFGIIQALVIITALGWDALMSGELFTNGHSHKIPRPARICLFFGYIVLVAAVVLFGASMHVSNATAVSGFFDSEVYPQRGMMLLGVPIIFAMALFPSRSHELQEDNPSA